VHSSDVSRVLVEDAGDSFVGARTSRPSRRPRAMSSGRPNAAYTSVETASDSGTSRRPDRV